MKATGFHLTTTGERRVQIAVRNRLNPKTYKRVHTDKNTGLG